MGTPLKFRLNIYILLLTDYPTGYIDSIIVLGLLWLSLYCLCLMPTLWVWFRLISWFSLNMLLDNWLIFPTKWCWLLILRLFYLINLHWLDDGSWNWFYLVFHQGSSPCSFMMFFITLNMSFTIHHAYLPLLCPFWITFF